MIGTFVLAGGNEFRAAYLGPDRAVLARLATATGQIMILPTSAKRDAPYVIAEGVQHFRTLAPDANIEGAMIIDEAAANDPAQAARIASAQLVYLTDGDPLYLVETLRGSEVLAAIAAVAARGGIVVGSGTSAMALGTIMRWPGAGMPGFGMVANIAVVPYHDAGPLPFAQVRAGVPRDTVVLGIPAGVNCISIAAEPGEEAHTWQVCGDRPVTIYRASGIAQAENGEQFEILPLAISHR